MGSTLSLLQTYVESNTLLKAAVVDLGIQWSGFFLSWLLRTEKFYDLTGSATYLYLTWSTLKWAHAGRRHGDWGSWAQRHTIQNSCVTVWALRLGAHLFSRVIAAGEDRRFRTAKQNSALMFTFWTIQALWVWITLLPTMILNTKEVAGKQLTWRDYTGYGLFAFGFLIEAIADQQKRNFRALPENQGKFITSGLWSWSRHPNYLGEIMLWTGLFLPASSVMSGYEWLSATSPLFLTYLLTKVSGVPLLERYADKKWGGTEAYENYKAATACLVPYIW